MSLRDILTGLAGGKIADEASKKTGLQKNQIIALLAVAAPLMISALRRNAERNSVEAEDINVALNKHTGEVLNNPEKIDSKDGSSILDHIFGHQKPQVEDQIARRTGLDAGKVSAALAALAPVVMGYLGQQKQQHNLTGSGISNFLGNILNNTQTHYQAQGVQNNSLVTLATEFLDKDNDGSMIDDFFNIFLKQ